MSDGCHDVSLPIFDSLMAAVRHFGGDTAVVTAQEPAPGGCINNGFSVTLKDGRRCFVKMNRRAALGMFRLEAAGLAALTVASRDCGAGLRLPQTFSCGTDGDHAFLVLEYLQPAARCDEWWMALGHGLATLHQGCSRDLFGFGMDNFIGSTPQRNSWSPSWPEFFAKQRLKPQLELARRQSLAPEELVKAVESIIKRADALIPPLSRASLVHGDLWSGNVLPACGPDGLALPALIDPAVYWGDGRVDLAMTELFGGFPAAFHDAYREVRDPGPEYRRLRDLYNLYHLLNHLNILGREYLADCVRVARSYA